MFRHSRGARAVIAINMLAVFGWMEMYIYFPRLDAALSRV